MNGVHDPVMLEEGVNALAVRADGVYVDGTFGRGGHTGRLLQLLGPQGRVIAFDRDHSAIAVGRLLKDPRLTMCHAPFSEMAVVVAGLGVAAVDGILLDLGVSSPQLDQAERGFSFRLDGPLDISMDQSQSLTAERWINEAAEAELADVIRTLGEERFARQVARAIVVQRQQAPIQTTRQLAQLVAQAVRTREVGQDPATRTFQAIRLFINGELTELAQVLPMAVQLLKPGGRLAVISFHSLEDRLVKRFFQTQSRAPDVPRGMAIREADRPAPLLVMMGKGQRPSAQEVSRNPRSRSAMLRVAMRTAA